MQLQFLEWTINFVSLRGNKTHLCAITSRNSNNPLLICRAFHPRTSLSITSTTSQASHHHCKVENDSQLHKKEEWLGDSPTAISLQRWGWVPEDRTVPSPVCWAALSWCRGPCLVATDSLPARQSIWKLALKKKKKKIKKQLSGCRRKMPASPCAVGTQRNKGAFLWQLWENYSVHGVHCTRCVFLRLSSRKGHN